MHFESCSFFHTLIASESRVNLMRETVAEHKLLSVDDACAKCKARARATAVCHRYTALSIAEGSLLECGVPPRSRSTLMPPALVPPNGGDPSGDLDKWQRVLPQLLVGGGERG